MIKKMIFIIIFFIILFTALFMLPPIIKKVEIIDISDSEKVKIKVSLYKTKLLNNNKYCMISSSKKIPKSNDKSFKKIENNNCSFEVEKGQYYIYIKDAYNHITYNKSDVSINKVSKIELNDKKVYLAVDDSYELDYSLIKVGAANDKIIWESSDGKIATVTDGIIISKSIGQATITAKTIYGNKSTTKVIVTNIISKMNWNQEKEYLKCGEYSKEDNDLLDDILKTKVENAGVGTRGGVLAAARFLTMEFDRKIDYFFENGRLQNTDGRHVDGEGRYYHKGLYLDSSRYENITATYAGPSAWGCPLKNIEDDYGYIPGAKYPNGLDCSGFVTWAIYNGGIDITDRGADNEFGENHELTQEYLNSREYKPGDLIGEWGHIAIIVGIDEENIYIAESLMKGVKIVSFSIEKGGLMATRRYTFINTMDKVYNGEGKYSDMW